MSDGLLGVAPSPLLQSRVLAGREPRHLYAISGPLSEAWVLDAPPSRYGGGV
jgi:hypothetical protein